MNKRQRNKRAKKNERSVAEFLRRACSGFVGQPVSAETTQKLAETASSYIRSMLMQQSFVSSIIIASDPILEGPFRQWQELGAGVLTHHVGTGLYVRGDGSTSWIRFCDYESVDSTYILSNDAPVTCLMCLGREDKIFKTVVVRDDRP